jgi:hypothetical protein
MDRPLKPAPRNGTRVVVRPDVPAHSLWVTVVIAKQDPGRVERALSPRLAIPTGVPI